MESCAMRSIATTAGRPNSALHNGSFWNPRKRSAAICRIRRSSSTGLNTRPQPRRLLDPPPNSKPVKDSTRLVGLAYFDSDETLIEQQQFFGRVVCVDHATVHRWSIKILTGLRIQPVDATDSPGCYSLAESWNSS